MPPSLTFFTAPSGLIGTNAGTIPTGGGLTGGFATQTTPIMGAGGGLVIQPPKAPPSPPSVPSLDSMLNKPEFTSKYLWNIDGQNVALYVAPPDYNGSYKVSDAGDAEVDTFSTDLRINDMLNNPSRFTRTQNGRLFVDLLAPLGKIYEVVGANVLKSTSYPAMIVAEVANQVKSTFQPPVVKPLPIVVTQEPPKEEPVKTLPVVVEEKPPAQQPPIQKQPLPVLETREEVPSNPPNSSQSEKPFQQQPVYVKQPELKLPMTSQVFTSDGALTSSAVSSPGAPLKQLNLVPEADSKVLLMAAIAAAGAGYFTFKAKGSTWAAGAATVAFFAVQKIMSLTK